MPEEDIHVIEDTFHRLQHPRPAQPATDQDIANAAQLAVWKCEPHLQGRIHATMSNGNLTLAGTADTLAQRQAVEAAVLALGANISSLTNAIEIGPAPKPRHVGPPPERHEIVGQPMVYLSRFCGTEPYSLMAALHGALDDLDERFAEAGLTPPEDVVVVYRNRLPESVMLDVGYVVPESAVVESDDEFKLGRTPEGTMLAAPAEYGSRGLFDVHDHLLRQARLADLSPANIAWQRFPLKAARLHTDHPAAPLYLPFN